MSLPVFTKQLDDHMDNLMMFMWTKQKDGQTIQKRKLVAKKRLFASYKMGGLQINDPTTTLEGLQINPHMGNLFIPVMSKEFRGTRKIPAHSLALLKVSLPIQKILK
jgi:hypothetical protein